MLRQKFNLFISFVMSLLILVSAISTVSAQYCPSSQLNYVVRDASGKIINPAKLDAPDFIEEETQEVAYAEAEKKREGFWALGEAVKSAREQKQGGLDRETGSLFVLHQSSAGCNFKNPVTYRLALGKNTMNLVFRFESAKRDYDSAVFLVDSPPFAQGTFEIELPQKSGYYAPALWRKTSDAAEAPAKISAHHIRGRVLDAVTKKPVAGATIHFQTSPPFYGKYAGGLRKTISETKTDVDGRFVFKRLRGDLLDSASVAAIFAAHPDFAAGKYAEVFAQTDEQRKKAAAGDPSVARFQSKDELTIEMTPLVTISGRVVDGKTGGNLAGAENLNIVAEYGKGGYVRGNLDIPRGSAETHPQPDGAFAFRTAPGENRIQGYGKIGEKSYILAGAPTSVGANGVKDLILKAERDPFEIRREAEALGKKGNDHFAAGRFDEALKSYKEAAELNPRDVRTHSAIVQTYAALKRPDEAVSFYRQKIAVNADDAFAEYALGLAFENAGKSEEAAAAFQAAARLKPDFAEAYGELSQSEIKLKKYDDALKSATKAVFFNPQNAKLLNSLGRAYEHLGKNDEAVKNYQQAVRLAPNVAVYHYNLGYSYSTLGQSEKAVAEFKETVRLDPNYVDAHTSLGMEFQNSGRYEEAIRHLTDALRLDAANQHALTSLVPAFLSLNRGAEAAADAEKFLAAHGWKHEQSVYMALFGAVGYKMNGKEAEAKKLLETAAKNTDKTRWAAPAIQYFLGKMSAENLLKLADDNDKMTEARAYVGINLLLAGKTEVALSHLRWVKENGNKSFYEYHLAKSTLERLGK